MMLVQNSRLNHMTVSHEDSIKKVVNRIQFIPIYELYTGGADFRCCSKKGHSKLPKQYLNTACCPARIPLDDSFYGNFSVTCMEIIRSQTITATGCPLLGAAQQVIKKKKCFTHPGSQVKRHYSFQVNAVTSFLDLSIIYGSSRLTCDTLRTFKNGQFQMNKLNYMSEDPKGEAEGRYRAGNGRLCGLKSNDFYEIFFDFQAIPE
jgi:hypothetical protein